MKVGTNENSFPRYSGILSDHFGRRPTMFAIMLLKSLSGLAAAYMNDFTYWIAIRQVNKKIH